MSTVKKGTLDGLGKKATTLINEYMDQAESATQHDLARMETQIWDALPAQKRHEWRRAYFFQDLFGGSTRGFQNRLALLNFGDNVTALWERIDPLPGEDRMALETAINIVKKAKKLYGAYPKRYPCLGDAIRDVLSEYDALPFKTSLADGTVIRKKAPPPNIPSRKDAAEQVTRSSSGRSSRNAKRTSGTSNGELSHIDMLNEMRQLVARYVALKLGDLDDDIADKIYSEFEVDLKVLLESLRQRLYSVQRQADEDRQLTERARRAHLKSDFAELGMDPPKPLGSPDITKIKRQYRALASAYHPDKQPAGGVDLSAKFTAVTQAYHRIIDYYRDQGVC